MMKLLPCVLAFTLGSSVLASAGAAPAAAKDAVTLQLKWVYQAQFAGYIVAKEKGFYDAQGLDVTIKPGGPDIAPAQVIAGGGADVIVDWLPSALAAREKGVPLVNIAQTFNRAGGNITCLRSNGIKSTADFKGKTIGVAFGGNEFPFMAWASKLGYSTTGPNPDIKLLKLGFNVDPLLQHQAACIATQIYNEYYQILDAGVKREDLITWFYSDEGVATLEDGLYVLQPKLADPAFVDKMARFVAASDKGWQFAIDHPEEAAKIVVDNDPAGVASLSVQTRQMKEIDKLVPGSSKGIGYLDPSAFDSTVAILLGGKSQTVITKKPDGGWTHVVWDKAETLAK